MADQRHVTRAGNRTDGVPPDVTTAARQPPTTPRDTEQVGERATVRVDSGAEDSELNAPQIVQAACNWAAQRDRPVLAYLLPEGDQARHRPDVPITKRTAVQVADAVNDDQFDDLDLMIQSRGGDIHAAYQITTIIRNHMNKDRDGKHVGELVVCVPGNAQSSATLLCLATDRILLGELGALGPLDAQIRVGITELGTPDYSSALHLLKAIDRLRDLSLETFSQEAALLYAHDVGREELIRHSIEFSRSITGPLFERIESHKIGYWDQMLQTGKTYGHRLLRDGTLLRDKRGVDRESLIGQALQSLVYGYPSHEIVLDAVELQKLGFNADLAEPAERAALRQFAAAGADTLIALIYPTGGKVPIPDSLASAPDFDAGRWAEVDGKGRPESAGWTDKIGRRFVMRVGLYRSEVAGNPWAETADADPARKPDVEYNAAVYWDRTR